MPILYFFYKLLYAPSSLTQFGIGEMFVSLNTFLYVLAYQRLVMVPNSETLRQSAAPWQRIQFDF